MWHEGTIGIPMQDGGYKIAHYWVKSFDEGSEWGINGGRISKLTIKIDGNIIVEYHDTENPYTEPGYFEVYGPGEGTYMEIYAE